MSLPPGVQEKMIKSPKSAGFYRVQYFIINELRMKAGVIESLFVIEFFEPINELENLGQTSVWIC